MKTRIEMIPNGVNRELFGPEGEKFSSEKIREKAGKEMGPNPPFIVSTSRFVKEKRIELLLHAMQCWGKGSLIAAGGGQDEVPPEWAQCDQEQWILGREWCLFRSSGGWRLCPHDKTGSGEIGT